MMKRYKKFALMAAAATFSTVAIWGINDNEEKMRLDFFNRNGERIKSLFGKDVASFRYLFNVSEYEEGFKINFDDGEDIVKMVMVPYGSESYTVSVNKNEDSDVEFYYKVLDKDDSDVNSEKLTGENYIKSGTKFRIYVKVPENTYPTVEKHRLYEQVSGESCKDFYSGFDISPEAVYWEKGAASWTDPDIRKEMSERFYGGQLLFRRVEGEAGWWCFETVADNQPLEFVVDCSQVDNDALKKSRFGVFEHLYTQSNGNAGYYNCDETFMMTHIGDFISQDMISALYVTCGLAEIVDINGFRNGNRWINAVPWRACFRYITHSNLLLDHLDSFDMSTTPAEREIAQAQMLTLRSHAYWRLLQIYAPRWSDSNGGSVLCAPLEMSFTVEHKAPATMKEIADQCYADLDKAIEIFQRIGYVRENLIEPDLNVAKGVKMRLALLREDWSTAELLASEILQTVPLTTNEELTSGLFKPSNSWIWGAWNNKDSKANLYYYSFQNLNSCNGGYPISWGVGGNAIDRDLYLQMDKNDVRRSMFLMPENPCFAASGRKNVDWWYRTFDGNNSIRDREITSILNEIKPEGIETGAYSGDAITGVVPLRFGAHLKFYTESFSGVEQPDEAVVFMRAEEVLLTHAEAAYHLDKKEAVMADLDRLNKMRLNGNADSHAGMDLLEQIILARKIELWGEGHSWYDQKRWNRPIKRNHFEQANTKSGNWPDGFVPECTVNVGNGWRMGVPVYYMNQNNLMNLDELGYKDMEGYGAVRSPEKRLPRTFMNSESIDKLIKKDVLSRSGEVQPAQIRE